MGRGCSELTKMGRGRRLQVSILRGLNFEKKNTGNFSARAMYTTEVEKMNLAVQL